MRLADVLAGDPEAFFEPAHLSAYGPDPAILIKLLDAGERLPLHFHPDAAFAARHLGSEHGKTEAWVILEAEPGATVHVGFARDVGADELSELVAAQDLEALLEAMNPLAIPPAVSASDARSPVPSSFTFRLKTTSERMSASSSGGSLVSASSGARSVPVT